MAFPSETIFPQERSASGQSALPERRWVRRPQWLSACGRWRKRVKMVPGGANKRHNQAAGLYMYANRFARHSSRNNILYELQLSYGGCY
ncbi:hypothetical protein K443DRAFT_261271 [Laccaria amethystina LaAM-08-1]|uniref:Unplaced genomic scaffold K443scaffold_169, whole genome shotgun sequence n=1 Tax=Laccaria amethystina LaAM-08-1 TaxID=1095629 RepID=A0A0C9WWP9_9AGAR|nr:hypothetical protein K443DRAFT_261271 [Laccaria amethystina LaAM-08-1]